MCNKEVTETAPQVLGVSEKIVKVQEFLRQANEPVRTKSLVEYTKEEAQWLLEAAMNYSSSDPDAKYGQLKFSDFEAIVPYVDGKVSEEYLLAAFESLQAAMESETLDEGDKVFAVDILAKTENGLLKLTTRRVSGKEEGYATDPLNISFGGSYRSWPGAENSSTTCGHPGVFCGPGDPRSHQPNL